MADQAPSPQLLNVEIDGVWHQFPKGTRVIEACGQAGSYVPRYCYHKKLISPGNCRMCLIEMGFPRLGPNRKPELSSDGKPIINWIPRPQISCAQDVSDGMAVRTNSPLVKECQRGVMEFLLINHPLECPICDQAGECRLHDLAVGYGGSNSRYQEPKRVVFNKNLGPLISTDMTRCIHCTRCVRFGQEIAGVMELSMIGRGEHAEIITFIGKTVDSELSGNVIDLCPVGALTSKPFRYTARTWELARRKSVSPHDGLGSNLVVQVKNDRVMRVVPLENEAVNECWISDKDRFSYEGLNSDDRLTQPMIKRDGKWVETDWSAVLEHTARDLK